MRRTQDGGPIAHLSVATLDNWRDKNTGERKERTEWHRVVIFSEPLCRFVEQYLKKGSKVYLEGSLQTRKWQDQSGQDKYTTQVVLQGFNSQLTLLDRLWHDCGWGVWLRGKRVGLRIFRPHRTGQAAGTRRRRRRMGQVSAPTWTTRSPSNCQSDFDRTN